MTKIKLSDQEVKLEIQYEYAAKDQHWMNKLIDLKERYRHFRELILINYNDHPTEPYVAHLYWLDGEIEQLTSEIGAIKGKPLKTYCTITFSDGTKIDAHVKLSHDDRIFFGSDKNLAREAVLRKALKLAADGNLVSAETRKELAVHFGFCKV